MRGDGGDRIGRPDLLVLATHQVNFTALTGQAAAAGEGVALLPQPAGFRVVASVRV